jgi:hypothetical protein
VTDFAIQLPSDGLYEPTVPERDLFPRVRSIVEDVVRSLQCHVELPETTSQGQWLQERVELTKRLTGWSNRALASALGTTHPTLGAILAGRQTTRARIPELRGRISALADLADRLMSLAGDPAAVRVALTTRPLDQSHTACELLIQGDPGRAYIAALDVLRPPTNAGYMRSEWTQPVSDATVELSPR